MSEMTPRERVLTALEHGEPDRVPISLGGSAHKLTDSRYFQLKEYFGIEGQVDAVLTGLFLSYSDNRLLDALGTDVRHVHLKPPRRFTPQIAPDGSFTDEWGLTRHHHDGYIEITGTPLAEATVDDLETYPWPDPYDPGRTAGLREEARDLYENSDCAVVAYRPVPGGIFEIACWLRGTEQLLVDLLLDPDLADALFQALLKVQLGFYEAQLQAVADYVHIFEIIDDLGTQQGSFMSPDLYRKLLKPKHAHLVDFIKQRAPQAQVMIHSCGSVYRLIGDFIDIGVDILNPVQPAAQEMDTRRLKDEFGDNITFLGGVDVQGAMRGSVQEVEREVKRRIADLAPGGGYILAPSHNLGDDVPLENILAFFQTGQEYGRYPLAIER